MDVLRQFRAFITAPHDGGITVTFEVGDKVIYPNQGLGVVTRIEEKTILGTTCGFYHLRIVANETTVLVPLDNVDGVGLRRAIGDEEVERLFNALGNGKIDNHQNWKGRFKDNSDKMRTGSIYDVADVLKSLTLLSRSKSLSFREKRMLDRAKFLIVSEISEVMRETAESIEGRVEKALERSFATRTRAIARAKAAKATPAAARRRDAPGRPGFARARTLVAVRRTGLRQLARPCPFSAFRCTLNHIVHAHRSRSLDCRVSRRLPVCRHRRACRHGARADVPLEEPAVCAGPLGGRDRDLACRHPHARGRTRARAPRSGRWCSAATIRATSIRPSCFRRCIRGCTCCSSGS